MFSRPLPSQFEQLSRPEAFDYVAFQTAYGGLLERRRMWTEAAVVVFVGLVTGWAGAAWVAGL